MSRRSSKVELEALLPSLVAADYDITSDTTSSYNCIAWAACDKKRKWWPRAGKEFYWPPEAPRTEAIDAFIAAFATVGYEPCDNGRLEEGYQKIAIYCDANSGSPKHAARQLTSGRWTSKLGPADDIEHADLRSVGGRLYGVVKQFMRRPRTEPDPVA